MASDPVLVARLQALLGARAGVEPRKMFGGVCFFLNGHMCVGVQNENLILRVGETAARELLTRAHVRPMDLTGRPMKGWRRFCPRHARATRRWRNSSRWRRTSWRACR